MVFYKLFLLTLFASLYTVKIQGQKENDTDDTKLFANDFENFKMKKGSNNPSGCPFAKLFSHKTFKTQRNKNQYQRALQLEQITRIQNKILKKANISHSHTINKRQAFPFFTSPRFPFRANTRHRYRNTMKSTKIFHGAKKERKLQRFKTNKEIGEDSKTLTKMDENNKSDNFECPLEWEESITNCQVTHPYRSFSGICNNLDTNKNFGKHSSILRRLLPSEYDDGISHPRKMSKKQGIELPNPRYISSVVHHKDKINLDYRYTLALMQWGQFLDHDITLTPVIDALAECRHDCKEDGSFFDTSNKEVVIGPCYSIPIPKGDKYFPDVDQKTNSKRCLPVIRSLPAQKYLGPRDQMNAITSYIDASNLYGSDPCMNQQLRENMGGKMKVLKHPMSPNIFKPLMPRHAHHPECKSPTGKCFMTGDDRNSEQPGLASMHTMMLREHNRIAAKLELLNPHWSDDKIFQEARKVIIAINQHITYNEFLPRVLGPDLMRHFDLEIKASKNHKGHYNKYDRTCSADIHNEFATAAYRFGHSLIRSGFDLMSEPNSTSKHLPNHILLRNHFFQPDVIFGVHTVDKLVRGMVNIPMETYDRAMSNEVTEHLFEEQGKAFSGQDLAALNIQRGREHGIPGYTKYLSLCSKMLSKGTYDQNFETFADLNIVMNSEASSLLSVVYNNIEDIDLFTGGLSESSLPGAVVGRTFGCIIGLQFQKLRKCDRFWYENPNVGFTEEQLQEIKKVTLSSILCRNWDVTSPIQKWAFDMPDPKKNPVQPCSLEYHPTINMFSLWRDKSFGRSKLSGSRSCDIGGRIVKPGHEVRISACSICSCSFPEGETECYSDVVKSCEDLVEQFGRSAVAVDIACKAQCPEIVEQADIILSAPPLVPV